MNERVVEHAGEALTLGEWAARTGVNKNAIGKRLNAGWSTEDALGIGSGDAADHQARVASETQKMRVVRGLIDRLSGDHLADLGDDSGRDALVLRIRLLAVVCEEWPYPVAPWCMLEEPLTQLLSRSAA